MTPIHNIVRQLLQQGISEGVFPHGSAGVVHGPPGARTLCTDNQRITPDAENPRTDNAELFFDLASLTKSFATLPAVLTLIRRGTIEFSTQLPDLLEQSVPPQLQHITLRQILSHSAGFIAHRPFFETIRLLPQSQRKEQLCRLILHEPLAYSPGTASHYSDLGYMLLTMVIEKKSASPFEHFVDKECFSPLNLSEHLFFNAQNTPRRVQYAPTEICPWRMKCLRGQVHDDNCYAIGGVSGHAGLFGNITGVLRLTTHFLDVWHRRTEHQNYRAEDLRAATRRTEVPGTTWGLGFDTPSQKGSSAGAYLSLRSFGHLGFTGTSFWIDPENDLVIVLLTNRVHRGRDNRMIRQFRPRFHNAIAEELIINRKKTFQTKKRSTP